MEPHEPLRVNPSDMTDWLSLKLQQSKDAGQSYETAKQQLVTGGYSEQDINAATAAMAAKSTINKVWVDTAQSAPDNAALITHFNDEYKPYRIGIAVLAGLQIFAGLIGIISQVTNIGNMILSILDILVGLGLFWRINILRIIIVIVLLLSILLAAPSLFAVFLIASPLSIALTLLKVAFDVASLVFLTRQKTKHLFR